MRSLLQRLWGRSALSRPASAPKMARRRRLRLEKLEDRLALSIAGGEVRIPTTTAGDQFETVNASSANGKSVVVWTHRVSSSNTDIRAQVLDSTGKKVGGEVLVATGRSNERDAAVAMDDFGNWKVVWTRETTSTNKDILAARYSADGRRLGSVTVAATPKNEYHPSIAIGYLGDFVVSYTLDFSATDQDIRARMYRDDGQLMTEIAVAETEASDETHSAVARSKIGQSPFAIAYQVGLDITLRRYNKFGQRINTHLIATGRASQTLPTVAMMGLGSVVVAWQEYITGDWDIKAREVSYDGFMRGTHTVASTAGQETNPSIAVASNLDYVVAFQVGAVVYVQEMNANGTRRTTNPYNLGVQSSIAAPCISMRHQGNYLVSYTDTQRSTDAGLGVYARRGFLE